MISFWITFPDTCNHFLRRQSQYRVHMQLHNCEWKWILRKKTFSYPRFVHFFCRWHVKIKSNNANFRSFHAWILVNCANWDLWRRLRAHCSVITWNLIQLFIKIKSTAQFCMLDLTFTAIRKAWESWVKSQEGDSVEGCSEWWIKIEKKKSSKKVLELAIQQKNQENPKTAKNFPSSFSLQVFHKARPWPTKRFSDVISGLKFVSMGRGCVNSLKSMKPLTGR